MKALKAKLFRRPAKPAASGTAWRPIDATAELDSGPPPEAIFDRTTGPLANLHVRVASTRES